MPTLTVTFYTREFPLAVVAKWLGNTQAVAMRHYVDVTDSDFERAIADDAAGIEKTAQEAAQPERAVLVAIRTPKGECITKPPFCKLSRLPAIAYKTGGMEAAGIEPASRDTSAYASTCVAD